MDTDDNTLFFPVISDGEDKSSPLKNRIRKNYRHLRKWAKRTSCNSFRIYDRDIKEYPLSIDYYAGRFCVQYFSSDRANDEASQELQDEVNEVLVSMFEAKVESIYWRSRIRRRKMEQYEKKSEEKEFFTVIEYGVKFKINLNDYLDTGLFLDHRETRRLVASLAKGKSLLNLFSYTSSFSVHAALAGAAFTKSVDLSNTYTNWSKDNFILNSLSLESNEVVRADCMKFLTEELRSNLKYDLIVIDPPTISRSKKMDDLFDIQKSYPFLLSSALKLLADGGTIFFSTNSRKFLFDPSLFPDCQIREITSKTIAIDFQQKKSHRCWTLRKNK
jgi:23S rRNA (cytosine1962-C5)-methyltransferase